MFLAEICGKKYRKNNEQMSFSKTFVPPVGTENLFFKPQTTGQDGITFRVLWYYIVNTVVS